MKGSLSVRNIMWAAKGAAFVQTNYKNEKLTSAGT